MWMSILAVCVGASLGALLRWQLGVQLNSYFPTVPPGTLAANLIGAFVVGAGIGYFAAFPAARAEWRLLLITGFCGGLTTFSTFSAEIVALLRAGQRAWACGAIAMHLGGSLVMTIAGIVSMSWLESKRM
jgi:fluoride exporter